MTAAIARAYRPDLYDMIHQLCDTTTHRQQFMRKKKVRYHVTRWPPLITQLQETVEPSTSAEAGIPRPAASKPAARLEAIDTAAQIDHAAGRWLRRLGQDDPGDTIACIRRIGALAASAGPATRKDIEDDVRRWWVWARVITGWDDPPWKPDNTCPLCGTRGTLRIRQAEKMATCMDDRCRTVWDPTTIGLLAEHIRAENQETLDPMDLRGFTKLRLFDLKSQANVDIREAPDTTSGEAIKRQARRILGFVGAELTTLNAEPVDYDGSWGDWEREWDQHVRRIAALFDDHPDYREEWRP